MSIPTVATGTCLGICIVAKRASNPSSLTFTGTPITGLDVLDAMNPGSWADRPAIAMKTIAFDESIYLESSFGFLCAERTFFS